MLPASLGGPLSPTPEHFMEVQRQCLRYQGAPVSLGALAGGGRLGQLRRCAVSDETDGSAVDPPRSEQGQNRPGEV